MRLNRSGGLSFAFFVKRKGWAFAGSVRLVRHNDSHILVVQISLREKDCSVGNPTGRCPAFAKSAKGVAPGYWIGHKFTLMQPHSNVALVPVLSNITPVRFAT